MNSDPGIYPDNVLPRRGPTAYPLLGRFLSCRTGTTPSSPPKERGGEDEEGREEGERNRREGRWRKSRAHGHEERYVSEKTPRDEHQLISPGLDTMRSRFVGVLHWKPCVSQSDG